MPSESQDRFKSRRQGADKVEGRGAQSESGQQATTGERPERRSARQPDNVSLYLSPRMMELAEELASQSGMHLRAYLSEALKYVLLAHGKRLGKTDKYVAEFVSQNRKKVSTWKAESEKPGPEHRQGGSEPPAQSFRQEKDRRRRPQEGFRARRKSSDEDGSRPGRRQSGEGERRFSRGSSGTPRSGKPKSGTRQSGEGERRFSRGSSGTPRFGKPKSGTRQDRQKRSHSRFGKKRTSD